MDEILLNDLLECSVCLERLDTSSKVLPCQHTFCRKCLQDIISANKELRCPECRVLVETKLDDLPPNVLLMRILEGMKNAVPKKRLMAGGSLRLGTHPPTLTPSLLPVLAPNHPPPEPNARLLPHTAALVKVPNQPCARAVYDYLSNEPGDLSFKKGDLVILRKKIDNNWYHGECSNNQGVFPLSYVQIMTPLPSHIPQCKGLYDFRMTKEEEDGCLTFNKGEVITVIRRVDENWAEGKLGERVGIFPLAFVELNGVARALMKLSINAQPGPSRLAPPTPTTEDATPLIPTDHTRTLSQQQPQPQQPSPQQPSPQQLSPQQPSPQQPSAQQPLLTGSDSSSSTTQTSPSSSASSTPASSTAPSSPTSPPPPQPPPTKRHSFNVLHHRNSAEMLSQTEPTLEQSQSQVEVRRLAEVPPPLGSPHASLQLPASYVALYPYKPQKVDELELKRGSVYTVTERCQDGWFRGTATRNHKSGVFPGNYVAPAKSLSALQAQVRGLPLGQKSGSAAPALQPRPRTAVSYTRQAPAQTSPRHLNTLGGGTAPELPPRSVSPAPAVGPNNAASWHGETAAQTAAGGGVSQEVSASPAHQPQSTTVNSPPNTALPSPAPTPTPRSADKGKDKKSVSLMRRLTSIKKSRSPPPSYSMDNPVFEDGTAATPVPAPASPAPQHVHIRSGSCPSQLLQVLPLDGSSPHHRLRSRHKPVPANPPRSEVTGPTESPGAVPQSHRKSNSLDGSERRTKQLVPPVRERFRCVVAYPPNSEYELELQVGDVIYVHRKRDDGWYKGTQQRTGKTGLFPASFVESF